MRRDRRDGGGSRRSAQDRRRPDTSGGRSRRTAGAGRPTSGLTHPLPHRGRAAPHSSGTLETLEAIVAEIADVRTTPLYPQSSMRRLRGTKPPALARCKTAKPVTTAFTSFFMLPGTIRVRKPRDNSRKGKVCGIAALFRTNQSAPGTRQADSRTLRLTYQQPEEPSMTTRSAGSAGVERRTEDQSKTDTRWILEGRI